MFEIDKVEYVIFDIYIKTHKTIIAQFTFKCNNIIVYIDLFRIMSSFFLTYL